MWHVLFGVMQNLMSVKVLVRLFVLNAVRVTIVNTLCTI